jgi:hypothetical protein
MSFYYGMVSRDTHVISEYSDTTLDFQPTALKLIANSDYSTILKTFT